MAPYPNCAKCLVCIGVKRFLDEYDDYRLTMTQGNLTLVSDHARGYMHGQISALSEVLQDMADLLPYIEAERALHQERKSA